MKPLAIDLYAGLGGWTEGLLDVGYRVVGFDNERHIYGDARYPAQLVIQDVLTLHGRQLKDAALIVAGPPCQAYSYRAMPWKRAKALPPPDNASKDDEPVFIICGRDPLAGMVVRVWAEAYRELHRGEMFMTDAQLAKYREAVAHATRLDEWALTSAPQEPQP